MTRYLLALDEGTTSARAIVYDDDANVVAMAHREFAQLYPKPGWVEHNPEELWMAQLAAAKEALDIANIEPSMVSAIGVTNQRETTVIWDKETGAPIYNAIVWQCRRTSEMVEQIKNNHGALIKEKTGLVPDSYFSAPKAKWILDNVPGAHERSERGELLLGTVDSYLIYRLTGGLVHATDPSNASRTLLYNIHKGIWDPELLEIFKVPDSMLPEVKPSSGFMGYTDPSIFGGAVPIAGCAGDQQAALFGHNATQPGDFKCTYGTGNFLLMNTGKKPVASERLLTTVAWGIDGETTYALEGSVFTTGAAIQWLRDGLGIIGSAEESETLAESIQGNDGVYMVPAFTGLGAPHWDQYARGAITGLTRGSTRAHIARAALESIAYQTYDLVDSMRRDSGYGINNLRVDGGAARNGFLMQFQSDLLGVPVVRPIMVEATARGAAYLAGLAADIWDSIDDLSKLDSKVDVFTPTMTPNTREGLLAGWRSALGKTLIH
ncbi:glycerol kinase GlpK [Candidatus Bathyarchaeota archaeon]|nr:MAG: glycerol kinase GlpK [Candidatus Bathyarchaeota archaeon]